MPISLPDYYSLSNFLASGEIIPSSSYTDTGTSTVPIAHGPISYGLK